SNPSTSSAKTPKPKPNPHPQPTPPKVYLVADPSLNPPRPPNSPILKSPISNLQCQIFHISNPQFQISNLQFLPPQTKFIKRWGQESAIAKHCLASPTIGHSTIHSVPKGTPRTSCSKSPSPTALSKNSTPTASPPNKSPEPSAHASPKTPSAPS